LIGPIARPENQMDTARYVRRATITSVMVSAALTILLFFLVFGGMDHVPIWGAGGWVFDFVPQSFMIALMSTLVPGLLARQQIRAGAVAAMPGETRLPRNLLARALVLAGAGAVFGPAVVGSIAAAVQQPTLAFAVALILKVAYGAVLAAVITPLGLRAALTCP
jgi:hypothetical protein